MHVIRSEIDVDQQNLAFVGFGERGGETSRERGRPGALRETGHTDKLGFVGELMEIKIETDAIPDRLAIHPDKMTSVPRREIPSLGSNNGG